MLVKEDHSSGICLNTVCFILDSLSTSYEIIDGNDVLEYTGGRCPETLSELDKILRSTGVY